MINKKKEVRIGCSGYYYSNWKKKFYNNAPASQWLSEYSKTFNSVELNGTFYKIPLVRNLEKQAKQTPDDFKFSVKANRHVTHILRLHNSKKENIDFEDLLMKGLGSKLGKILFQMPPSFHYTEENLEAISKNISDSGLNVIEFRHISWWNETVFDFFRSHNYVFCNVDFPGLQPDIVNTGKNFYLRLHGVPYLFKSPYSLDRLKELAAKIPENCTDYSIYFNNTAHDNAFQNALSLREILDAKFAL